MRCHLVGFLQMRYSHSNIFLTSWLVIMPKNMPEMEHSRLFLQVTSEGVSGNVQDTN
jgi:hypothetical protein